jgi:hypothetical protein
MTVDNVSEFSGFIKDLTYFACLADRLEVYDFEKFNINNVKPYGRVCLANSSLAFSKWVSPKRTRSYPFERLYNTYNDAKIITIIPVIKDEGEDGDLDKIQYSTVSWMNLLNIYIILTYYKSAKKDIKSKNIHRQKLTQQELDNDDVKSQIIDISKYKQSALHWNRSLFERKFSNIFKKSIDQYKLISEKTGVRVHNYEAKLSYLGKINEDFEQFKNLSLKGSEQAAKRESKTLHEKEFINDGVKGVFKIKNYLGGIYHITADEIIFRDGRYLIQESKNSTKKIIPSISDIKDGLFKLILFSNLDRLENNGNQVKFLARLKLTGRNIKNFIVFPATGYSIGNFIESNREVLSKKHIELLYKLQLESEQNTNLEIEIRGNFK